MDNNNCVDLLDDSDDSSGEDEQPQQARGRIVQAALLRRPPVNDFTRELPSLKRPRPNAYNGVEAAAAAGRRQAFLSTTYTMARPTVRLAQNNSRNNQLASIFAARQAAMRLQEEAMRLQAMGQTNDSAIDIEESEEEEEEEKEEEEEEEEEVQLLYSARPDGLAPMPTMTSSSAVLPSPALSSALAAVRTATTTSSALNSFGPSLASSSALAVQPSIATSHLSARENIFETMEELSRRPDPVAALPRRSFGIAAATAAAGRPSQDIYGPTRSNYRPPAAARGRDPPAAEGGAARNPIILWDVDTEEDFKEMERDVEIVEIEDSSDEDDDDSTDDSSDEESSEDSEVAMKPPAEEEAMKPPAAPVQTTSLPPAPVPSGPLFAPPAYAPHQKVYRGRTNYSYIVGASAAPTPDPYAPTNVPGRIPAAAFASQKKKKEVASDDTETESENESGDSSESPVSVTKAKTKASDDRKPAIRRKLPMQKRGKTKARVEPKPHHNSMRAKRDTQGRFKRKPDGMVSTDTDYMSCDSRTTTSSVAARMPSGEGTREITKDTSQSQEADSSDDEAIDEIFERRGSNPYTSKEYKKLWHTAEERMGATTKAMEKGKGFKQVTPNELYGRVLPAGMKKIFTKVMKIQRKHNYLDIGHGIGNTCIQAAYMIGCNAKGIECNKARCVVADKFTSAVGKIAGVHQMRDGMSFVPGKLDLREGMMQDKQHREWLISDTDFAFVNNFGGSFSKGVDLDPHIAAIFAGMKVGAVMVSLSDISSKMGCLNRKAANKKRRSKGLPESDNASWYETSKAIIGAQSKVASWSENGGCDTPLPVYIYTRIKQSADSPVFLCNNPECDAAIKSEPIKALEFDHAGVACIGVCGCRTTDKPNRAKKKVEYFSPTH